MISSDFKMFPIMLLRQLNFGVLPVKQPFYGDRQSYGECRVTVYDVIFGELGLLIVTPLNYPNYIENQI